MVSRFFLNFEALRYITTGDPDSILNCNKAFNILGVPRNFTPRKQAIFPVKVYTTTLLSNCMGFSLFKVSEGMFLNRWTSTVSSFITNSGDTSAF
jgi:hypothetical protein